MSKFISPIVLLYGMGESGLVDKLLTGLTIFDQILVPTSYVRMMRGNIVYERQFRHSEPESRFENFGYYWATGWLEVPRVAAYAWLYTIFS